MGMFSKKKAGKLVEEGMKLHKLGDLRGAEMRYVQSLSFDPNSIEAHLNYGDLLKATQRPKAAEIEYRKAMIMDPERGEPHASLGSLYHSQGRHGDAEVEYNLAYDLQPGNLNVQLNLAQLYMDTTRYTEMKKMYSFVLPKVKDPKLRAFIEDRMK